MTDCSACGCSGGRRTPSSDPFGRLRRGILARYEKDVFDRQLSYQYVIDIDNIVKPLMLVQSAFEFVEDRVGRYWDCCALVTNDGKPCRAIARLIAIVANWWNIFCRLADGDGHLELTTSRPMYMGVVGRLVVSGRKRLLRLTSTHLKAREIQSSLMRIGEFMNQIYAIFATNAPENMYFFVLNASENMLLANNLHLML